MVCSAHPTDPAIIGRLFIAQQRLLIVVRAFILVGGGGFFFDFEDFAFGGNFDCVLFAVCRTFNVVECLAFLFFNCGFGQGDALDRALRRLDRYGRYIRQGDLLFILEQIIQSCAPKTTDKDQSDYKIPRSQSDSPFVRILDNILPHDG